MYSTVSTAAERAIVSLRAARRALRDRNLLGAETLDPELEMLTSDLAEAADSVITEMGLAE